MEGALRIVTVIVGTFVFASTLSAESVLVPIAARDVPGANSSIWRSTLAVTNHSDHPVYVHGIEPCFVNPCAPPSVLPGTTAFATVYPYWVSISDTEDLADIKVSLRVQDISRQAETWGATIPTVRESDALASPEVASLVDIPITPEFRSLLRIYDFDRVDRTSSKQVRVRYYTIDPARYGTRPLDTLLEEAVYDLLPHPERPPWEVPRMATIPFSGIEALAGGSRVRIEVEAVSNDLHFWAFVSVTNNETQHVTIISP